MNLRTLAAGLDDIYANRAYEVCKSDVMLYALASEFDAQAQLDEWAELGYIQILKRLEHCADSEKCIRLLKFIRKKNVDH